MKTLVGLLLFLRSIQAFQVVYTINFGGGDHTGPDGVHYMRDTASFGWQRSTESIIGGVTQQDGVVYQTNRQFFNMSIGFPIVGDGKYLLVLKFAEFEAPSTPTSPRVMDGYLNGDYKVISGLNVYTTAGVNVAHDVRIPFVVRGAFMEFGGRNSFITAKRSSFLLQGLKGHNALLNAAVLLKGDDVEAYPRTVNI
jgi:Malectin domain